MFQAKARLLPACRFFIKRKERINEKLNVLSHNRDDHAKNFSFLMDDSGTWKMAPAYDLTFSSGPGGEQSTMVMGEGKNPGVEQLLKLAEVADLSRADAQRIIDETVTVLQQWKELAKSCGVSKANIKRIKEIIC